MKFTLEDVSTHLTKTVSMTELLDVINRDRSPDWTKYNRTDWKEGWFQWCEGDCYNLVKIIK